VGELDALDSASEGDVDAIVDDEPAAGSPDRSSAAFAATSPRSAAERDAKAPPNRPIGVRAAERMKTGFIERTLARGCAAHVTSGSFTFTVVPRSTSLAISTFPLCASTIHRTMDNPSPDPPV